MIWYLSVVMWGHMSAVIFLYQSLYIVFIRKCLCFAWLRKGSVMSLICLEILIKVLYLCSVFSLTKMYSASRCWHFAHSIQCLKFINYTPDSYRNPFICRSICWEWNQWGELQGDSFSRPVQGLHVFHLQGPLHQQFHRDTWIPHRPRDRPGTAHGRKLFGLLKLLR